MATIKDIAEAAGVSRGTVSNVLNGRDVVSSEKIQKVMKVVEEMGYSINEKAQNLRKGSAKLLAVAVPNIEDSLYADFYTHFHDTAEKKGYVTDLYITNDNPDYERSLIQRMKSRLTEGVAVFSSISDGSRAYFDAGFSAEDVMFVSRKQPYESSFLGFDMEKAGMELAEYAARKGCRSAALVTGPLHCDSRKRLLDGFAETMKGLQPDCTLRVCATTRQSRYQDVNRIFSKGIPDIVITENVELARIVKNVWQDFYKEENMDIVPCSSVCAIPDDEFVRFEMDYRALGELAAERLIEKNAVKQEEILPVKGIAQWPKKQTEKQGEVLNVLSVGSPTTTALKTLSKYYKEVSGNQLVLTELSADSVYELLKNWGSGLAFDIVRMDKEWFPWLSEQVLEPLKAIDRSVEDSLAGFLSSTLDEYAYVKDELYAFPGTPSVQLLFYRKDLFEDTKLKRLYYEQYKTPLKIPETFKEFNQIARFFTRSFNEQSPVKYGCTFIGGKDGVAGVEFLNRYFSHTRSLKNEIHSEETHEILKIAWEETEEAWEYSSKRPHSWWTDGAQEFADGETAMTIQFTNHAAVFTKEDSRVRGKLGWAMSPGGNPFLGGSVIGISKYSEKKQASLDFLKWISRDDMNTALTLFGGMPAREAAYENSEIKNSYPWMSFAKTCFESAWKELPDMELKTLQNLIGAAVRTGLTGISDEKSAEAFVQRIYDEYEKYQHEKN